MLLRFVVKNLYSFKEETEFNMFPSSRAAHHLHHKIKCGHAEALRFTSLYGANGAGKSNLIKALIDLQIMVARGTVGTNSFQFYKFQLDQESLTQPVSLAIEFCHNDSIYYYSLELDTGMVYYESLSVSEHKNDRLIFERKSNGTQSVVFGNEYQKDKKSKVFFSAIEDRMLNKDALLLSFMAVYYPDVIDSIKVAYSWIVNDLIIVKSDNMKNIAIAQLMDTNPQMMSLLRTLLHGMGTGISNMDVVKTEVAENQLSSELVNQIKSTPGVPRSFPNLFDSRINDTLVFEDGRIIQKALQPYHSQGDGSPVKMPINFESDGTIRLIEYVPLLYLILNQGTTVIIDEVERSLHPILIKDIIENLSNSETAKGQLVFTTHESCLLDQEILRPDEIWFAQKDEAQATQLYPLSDFNIHKTASIEKGYLNGRYGGIPFLANLKDLNW